MTKINTHTAKKLKGGVSDFFARCATIFLQQIHISLLKEADAFVKIFALL